MSTPRSYSLRLVISGLAIATIIGCKKADTSAASDTSNPPAAAVTPVDTAAPAPASSASSDAQPDPGIASFTDANIVSALDEGDSKEVTLAGKIAPKITNADLKDYAHLLVTDHTKSRTEGRDVAKKAGITPQAPAGDSSKKELADLEARFAKIPKGADFDTAFVNYAIQDHKQDIADHRAMQSQAKSQAIKDEIEKGLPTLQQHLDKAQELSGKLH